MSKIKTSSLVKIHGAENIVDIDVISDEILMLKDDGTIIKWGKDSYSDLHTDIARKIATRNYSIHFTIGSSNMVINGIGASTGHNADPFRSGITTYIPLADLAGALGGSVEWLPNEQKIIINLWNKNVEMQIGSNVISVNGKNVILRAAPVLSNHKTMNPTELVRDVFGFTVSHKTYASGKSIVSLYRHEFLSEY